MKTQKISFAKIIESLEARWFMSSMATGAMGIFTFLIFTTLKIILLKYLALGLIFIAFLIFVISSILTIRRCIQFPKAVLGDSKHPIASNFFAGISISAGVLSTAISNVLIPLKIFPLTFASNVALYLYLIAIVLGIFFFVAVFSQLVISEKTKTNHALGIWLLPSAGVFVSVFSGNFASLHLSIALAERILMANLFFFGIALFGYFYTMTTVFHRIKFHPLPSKAMAPSFLIPLAPIGVSVIALFGFVKGFARLPEYADILSSLTSFFTLYTPFIIGFGLFWILATLRIVWHYIQDEGIPFSLGFWAFVFPIDAFGIGVFLFSRVNHFAFLLPFAYLIWGISFVLWVYVSYKTFLAIKSGKAFDRPKSVQ